MKDQLEQLPSPAIAAFATRCAMRAWPQYDHVLPGTINRTICYAIEQCNGQSQIDANAVNPHAIRAVGDAAANAATRARNAGDQREASMNAHPAAAAAAAAARATGPKNPYALREATEAASCAAAAHNKSPLANEAQQRDLDLLRELVADGHIRFDVSEFGPLGSLGCGIVLPTHFYGHGFAGLSSRAAAAFAARCVMRVRPIFTGESAPIIDRAIGYARDHAEGSDVRDEGYAVLPCLAGAADVKDVASESHRRHAYEDWHVAWAVAHAAYAAASSANGNISEAILGALSVANKAEVAAEDVAYSQGCRNSEAVAHLRDLRTLKELVADGQAKFDLSDTGPLGPLHRLD